MKTPPLLANAAEDVDDEEEPTRTPDLNGGGGAPGRGGGPPPPPLSPPPPPPDLLDEADEDFGMVGDPEPASDKLPPSLLMRFMCGCGSEGG